MEQLVVRTGVAIEKALKTKHRDHQHAQRDVDELNRKKRENKYVDFRFTTIRSKFKLT